MSLRSITRKDPAHVRAEFPICDLLEGWFFRQTEMTAGNYLVEGTDLWGRTVSRSGSDPDGLLSQCVLDAQEIEREVKRAF
jgi:hypothetical protein